MIATWYAEPGGECLLHDGVQSARGGVSQPYQRCETLLQLSSAQQAFHESSGGVLDLVYCHNHRRANVWREVQRSFQIEHVPLVCLSHGIQSVSLDATFGYSIWVCSHDGHC